MYYLPLTLLTWAVSPWVIDRQRIAELSIYGLLGAVLSTIQDRLMLLYLLWEYVDVGPFNTHTEIALLISLGAAPVVGMRFAQGLTNRFCWHRCFRYTLGAMAPEIVGLYAGKIVYHQWWTVLHSVCAYVPIWLSFWLLYRYMNPTLAQVNPGTEIEQQS